MSDNEDYFSNNSDSDSENEDISISSDDDDDEDLNLQEKNINDDEIEDEEIEIEDDDGDLIVDNDDDEEIDVDVDEDEDYDYNMDSQDGGAEEKDILEKSVKNKSKKKLIIENDEDDEEDNDNDNDDENYLQKFNSEINKNYVEEYHPECIIHNFDEISVLTQIIRDEDYNIIDPLHRTIPFLTKYEKTRVIGQRAKQINSGAKPFIQVPENIIDGYLIAEMELQQKRIPFIIRRPLNNGGSEYWNLKDLEIIDF